MPLIIICGNPSVGKTVYANQISEYLKSMGKKCIILNEETLSISKAIYKGTNIIHITQMKKITGAHSNPTHKNI